jgi:hypothetical protein
MYVLVSAHRAVRAGLTEDEQSELEALCGRCLWHSLQTCVRVRGLGESTFVGESFNRTTCNTR